LFRYTINRLLILPVGVLLSNILGFGYAFYIGPVQALRNPYSYGVIDVSNFWIKYWDYFSGALLLDLGRLPNNDLIQNVILRSSIASFGLLLISIVLSVSTGVVIGMMAVNIDPPHTARWLTLLSTAGLASPGFFVGIILISLSIALLINGIGIKPVFPFQGFGWDAHLVLPVLTLMFQPTVKVARITAGLLEDELGKQYVMVARSLGHTPRSILMHQAFRNILVPVITTAASSMRMMIVELIIVERLFNRPGLGKLISSVLIMTSDSENFLYPPLLATLTSILVLVFLFSDLLAGLIAHIFDPRLKYS
jgi:ABC-type dipeptide/oligopeptide/nickel transport system permease component